MTGQLNQYQGFQFQNILELAMSEHSRGSNQFPCMNIFNHAVSLD